MAYRRPAVTVIQEFVGLVPALALFNLPSVAIGAAYQLVDSDLLGNFTGVQHAFAYASLMAGAKVDLEEMAEDEVYPATKKPVEVHLTNAVIQILPDQIDSGAFNGTTLFDAAVGVFADVKAGDNIVIKTTTGVSVLSAQIDGASVSTSGLRDRLNAGTAGQFANVKAGDQVVITGGTNAVAGTFTVLVKINNDSIKLDADVNDGVGASSDTAYSITGARGAANFGSYKVKSKTDDNNLVLESPVLEAEALVTYEVRRDVSDIELARVASLPNNGFLAEAAAITLPAVLSYTDADLNTYVILSGQVKASYRALRNDMSANVKEFSRLDDLEAFFGTTQITPANPLAFALRLMLQNTTTPVNGLGLDGSAMSDEVGSFQNALDVLALTDMYALAPLTQNPVVHQLFKPHVDQLSADQKERAAIINRKILTVEHVVDEATTSNSLTGARIIVNTQVDGAHNGVALATLNDATTDAFLNVKAGDSVVIQSGTNVTPGTYTVLSAALNSLVLTSNFVTGVAASDVQYYIQRKDGLDADGIGFYDRNATFISGGVAPGYYLLATGPSGVVGRHKITGVISDKELQVEQIPGVATHVNSVAYSIERDLSKTEQANFIKGYSAAIGDRRMVNIWPDILETPVGQTVEELPGFYGAAVIAAITTGLPTQQGFTNLSISGFLGLKHSTGYFTDPQLDTIADGGTMILAQEGEEQPLFIRHQLTTDRSSIKFQEYSVTKNVDFIAKYVRDAYKGYPGKYNIVDTTLDELRGNAKAVITFLKDDTRLPRIGGVIRSGNLVLLEESTTQIDTVKMRFKFNIPIPLNNLDITIEV